MGKLSRRKGIIIGVILSIVISCIFIYAWINMSRLEFFIVILVFIVISFLLEPLITRKKK